MGDDACIVYYNDEEEQIVIEPSKDSELGYKIRFRVPLNTFSTIDIEEPDGNISFYRSGKTLVIYGTENGIRSLKCYTMDNKKLDYERLEKPYLDLYGTGVDPDEARYFNEYGTLIKSGNKFALYHLGEELYSTTFEGGEIAEWNYHYLLTQNGDCYNVYYSIDEGDCWVKFFKVAENVDEILEDERVVILDNNGYEMSFATLKIGNKRYAQIPDATTERTYGQNYGGNNRNEENVEVDFTTRLIEISAVKSSKVKMELKLDSWRGEKFEWYLYYYFQVDDKECYISRSIKGLDRKVSEVIPQSKLDMFNEKKSHLMKSKNT